MTIRVSTGLVLCMAVAFSCHSTKKTTTASTANEPAIQLDTIQVTANEPPKKEIYRASNPITHDLVHTELEVRFDWAESKLYGRASIQAKPHFYPTDILYLNARGMEIRSVEVYEEASVMEKKKVGNKVVEEKVDIWNTLLASSFKYYNDTIKVNLGRIFTSKENYYVVIDYVAKPNELKKGGSAAINDDKGLYFINPKGENPYKMPQIWTQGETQSNSAWFPTIDSPNSKMMQEIAITVEDKYTTLSNGTLVDTKKDGNMRTDRWKLDLPHAPYLAMMAIGEFVKVEDEPWKGKEVSYYVEKEYAPYAKDIFGDTKEMIEFYSNKLGVPYAWPKYAQVVARDYVSGAMENTSATLHGDFMVYQTTREMIDGKKGEDVIAHELFHQWFGDLVTSESWSNLPLNESFATYGEYLWEEYKFGRDAADYHHYQSRQGYLASNKEVNLIRYQYDDREDMFDGFSYNKGGQVLHMLRKAVGDDAFFASLKRYLEANKFRSAEIHNLRLAFEEVTGRDMNWFFNQWFLNKGRPKIKVTKNYNSTNKTLELTVEQTQDFKNVPLYTLPLEVDLYVDGDVNRQHLVITEARQTFTLMASSKPQLVNFDAERQLLCDLDYVKPKEEYIYQYRHAPLFEDRREALKNLENEQTGDTAAYHVFKWAARNDPFHAIRDLAISKIDKGTAYRQEVMQLLTDIYNTDKDTKTRTKALSELNKNFSAEAPLKTLNEKGLAEQSYAICGEAFQYFAKSDPELGMQKAKQFEKETGKDILYPVMELYSNRGGDDQIAFFRSRIPYFNGFELMSFCSLYAKTAKRCTQPANVLMAAQDLAYIGKGANRFVKYTAAKGVMDLVTVWENKEKSLKDKPEAAAELKTATDTKDALMKMYDQVK